MFVAQTMKLAADAPKPFARAHVCQQERWGRNQSQRAHGCRPFFAWHVFHLVLCNVFRADTLLEVNQQSNQ